MPTLLITGANRGIGLELARRYALAGWRVHAACRDPSKATALTGGDHIKLHRCDMRHEHEIDELAQSLKGEAIDLLINNAGVLGPREVVLGRTHMKDWLDVFGTNTAAPFMLVERLQDNLAAGHKRLVVNISSILGSLGQDEMEWSPIYGASKAALNMVTRHLAQLLKKKNITVVSMHPGWVQTDMGGSDATITVIESAKSLMDTIAKIQPAMSGGFFDRDGSVIVW